MSKDNKIKHIKTKAFSDIEKTLIREFGPRFTEYRNNYKKSLSYENEANIPDFPLTVSFELVNRCNLKCIMCYTDNHKNEKFTLEMQVIQSVLDECQQNNTPAAVIGMGSEALLFKDMKQVVSSMREHGIMDIFFGTNATLMTESVAEFFIDQKVARVEISLDAATPETYKRIRTKDELNIVEKNLQRLIELKKQKNSALPIIRLCFCVQPENAHERDLFVEKWKDHVEYIDFQEMVDFRFVNTLIAQEYEKVEAIEQTSDNTHCAYPFNSLNIWSNGDVSPCCTFYGKALIFGNVKKDSLKDIWNGDKIKTLRQELLNGDLNPVCKICFAERDRVSFSKIKS